LLRIFAFNMSGRLALLLISLVSIPIYVHHLGVANYGIIGIYNSLTTLAAVFDVAFSNTINRELAYRLGSDDSRAEVGAIFRTLEIFAWLVAAALALLLIGAARPLVDHWIGAGKYPGQDLVGTVRLMSALLLIQVPMSLYGGALYGLHRHGLINGISVIGTVATTLLSIYTVAFLTPSVDAFLTAQAAGRTCTILVMGSCVYRLLRRALGTGAWRGSLLHWQRLRKFTLGMNGVGLLSLLSTQADMMVLSRLLPAEPLGAYAVAKTAAQTLITLATPAYQSALPQLSRYANSAHFPQLLQSFHRSSQYLALVLIPAAVVLMAFPAEILMLWTHDAEIGFGVPRTLSLLAAGCMLYGLSYLNSALFMAHGAVPQLLWLGMLFVGLLVPLLLGLVPLLMSEGAGLAWLAVNVVNFLVGAVLLLRRFLPGEAARWLCRDLLIPLLASVIPVVLVKSMLDAPAGSQAGALSLLTGACSAFMLTLLMLPEGRLLAARGVRLVCSLVQRP
jgi:O-antigen/teichoic acid export membrane protein